MMAAITQAADPFAERENFVDLSSSSPVDSSSPKMHKLDAACPSDKTAAMRWTHLLYECSLQKAPSGLHSVTALACSPQGTRICAATNDRLLRFLGGPPGTDEAFLARAADKGKALHLVTGIAFNHDGSQLAVTQSDGVAHVYGVNAEGRRCICCRLPVECPATCVAWAIGGSRLLFIGLQNGKVRVADVQANKLGALHEAHSPVTCLTCTTDGTLVISGHRNGQLEQIGTAVSSALISWHPHGPWLAVASGEEVTLLKKPLLTVVKRPEPNERHRIARISCPGIVAVTAMAWEADGVTLCVGTARGSIEKLCAFHKKLTDNRVEIVLTLCNTLVERTSKSGPWLILHRDHDEFEWVDMQRPVLQSPGPQEHLVLAFTKQYALGIALTSRKVYKLSVMPKKELKWLAERNGFCLFHEAASASEHVGQIYIIRDKTGETGQHVTSLHADFPLRWLGLAERSIVFVTGEGQLMIAPLDDEGKTEQSLRRHVLLTNCSKAAMLSDKGLLVAQKNHDIFIWYNVENFRSIDVIQANGSLIGLEACHGDILNNSSDGQEEVVLVVKTRNGTEERHCLCPLKMKYERCLGLRQYEEALSLLSNLPESAATRERWRRLRASLLDNTSLEMLLAEREQVDSRMLEALQQRITLAARAAAAAGDIADAQFLEGLLEDRGLGNTEKSIEARIIRQKAGWTDCIRVLEQHDASQAENIKHQYKEWLLKEQRFEEAAGIFARQGQVKEAAELFLKGRVPAKAAALICKSLPPAETSPGQPLGIQNAQEKVDDLRGFVPVGMFSPKLIESTVEELKRIDLHEVAADLLAHLGHWRKALSLHQKCRNFPKAVAIAEAVARDALPGLHKSWAEANLEEGKKARQLLKGQRDEASVQKLLAVARKLEDQGDMSEAEQAYLEIVRNAPSREKLRPFMQQLAQQLAAGKKFEDAEAVLLAIGDVQGALQLLQTHSQFDRLILLIDTQCPAERDAICMRLASRLADIGSYSDAERFFLACGAWQQAADMYADVEDWAAACRVAASEGGAAASRRMCLRHAQKLLRLRGPKAAVQMLVERGECGAAVELAVENREFPLAIETARKHCLEKTKEVYMQLGRHKEASGDTSEAENAYLKAQAPEAAIALYKKRGAQAALLEAGRADLVVQLLLRKEQWAAAVRLCGEKAKEMLPWVLQQYNNQKAQFESIQELREFCKVTLARALGPSRHAAVASAVAQKLRLAGDLASAGELYMAASRGKEALKAGNNQDPECYISAEEWERASAVASSLGVDAEAELARCRSMQLKTRGDIDGLLKSGDTESALMLLAEANEWARCLDIASEQQHPLLSQLLKTRVQTLMELGSAVEAAETLGKFGGLVVEHVWPLCERVTSTLEVCHLKQQLERHSFSKSTHQEEGQMDDASEGTTAASNPFAVIKQMYSNDCEGQPELKELAAKAAISVLRYLDLADFIDERELASFDGRPFREMGLPIPKTDTLPKDHSVPSVQQEQARDLVLGWSVNPAVKPEIPTSICDGCGASVCSWAVTCVACSKEHEPCIVTGFPIPKGHRSFCNECDSPAASSDLALYTRHFSRSRLPVRDSDDVSPPPELCVPTCVTPSSILENSTAVSDSGNMALRPFSRLPSTS
ncbi:hypothetical protein cyc_04650 [Cyclospora cayetanensis]|uniref:Intraflagellar transport protein 172 homolog n=1 Tax=Cyclospora cayetanensis TaxID=88456 RepID=A0A1D3CYS4_9EIME|nr:hypothetical protein cyc_04650 [Cyclospora cayetanensis]